MKSYTEYLTFNLPARMAFENITPKVEASAREGDRRITKCRHGTTWDGMRRRESA